MNRIDTLFKEKKNNIVSVFLTAGYPEKGDTLTLIKNLSDAGVDMLEIGMPFSDPLADGPVIQKSSEVALKNGMSIKKLLQQLKDIRKITDIPLLLMGYLNPVMQYGVKEFCEELAKLEIDGLILPDLPLAEFLEDYEKLFTDNNLYYIPLITPQTPVDREKFICQHAKGFIYMVATSGTTGSNKEFSEAQQKYFQRIKNLDTEVPKLIGFGIKDKETFSRACEYANGAIIGSAFIKHIEKNGIQKDSIEKFVSSIR